MSLRIGGLAVDDVEDLLDDDRDAAAVVGVDDDLEHLAVGLAVGAQVPVEPDDRQDRAAVLDDLAVADLLDRVGADLLEAGDRVERDGDPPAAADGGQQHPLALGLAAAAALRRGRCESWRSAVSVRSARRASACTSRISATVPSPRTVAPEYRPIAFSWPPTRLDDDLLGVDDAVDDQAEPAALGPQHRDDDVAVVPLGGAGRGRRSRRTSGQQLAAQPVDLRAADLLDRVGGLLGVEADQLLQADLRDGVAVAGALDGQRRDDRQGQRDAQPADGARGRPRTRPRSCRRWPRCWS